MMWYVIISTILEHHCDWICDNEYNAGAPL